MIKGWAAAPAVIRDDGASTAAWIYPHHRPQDGIHHHQTAIGLNGNALWAAKPDNGQKVDRLDLREFYRGDPDHHLISVAHPEAKGRSSLRIGWHRERRPAGALGGCEDATARGRE